MIKLTVPIGEEPPETRNRKANRSPATETAKPARIAEAVVPG